MKWVEQVVVWSGVVLVLALVLLVPDWEGLKQAYMSTLKYHIYGRY